MARPKQATELKLYEQKQHPAHRLLNVVKQNLFCCAFVACVAWSGPSQVKFVFIYIKNIWLLLDKTSFITGLICRRLSADDTKEELSLAIDRRLTHSRCHPNRGLAVAAGCSIAGTDYTFSPHPKSMDTETRKNYRSYISVSLYVQFNYDINKGIDNCLMVTRR